jgi:hypothetical protein
MQGKFQYNNSTSYEYLIHGQDLKIEFKISDALFTIVNYKKLHTRVWFHKAFSSIYYIAPFYRFYNFLINKNFPGLKNKKLVATNFDYPGTSYKYQADFIPNCILDNKFKIMSSEGTLNTIANFHYPTIVFIGIGFGFKVFRKKLVVKIIDLKEEVTTIQNTIQYPNISKKLTKINPGNPLIKTTQNPISLKKLNLDLKTKQPIININESLTKLIIIKN